LTRIEPADGERRRSVRDVVVRGKIRDERHCIIMLP
jgi:hypothetical protein